MRFTYPSNTPDQDEAVHNRAEPLSLREELLPGAFDISEVEPLNRARVAGSGPVDVTTPPGQWAFAAAFPFRWRTESEIPREVLVVRVEAQVHTGRIGIGCVRNDLETYVSTEKDWTAGEGRAVREFLLERADSIACGWLIVRNTAEGNQRSAVTVHSITTFRTGAVRIPDLVETKPAPDRYTGRRHGRSDLAPSSREFRVLLTHTSREWDYAKCSRQALVQRYADPRRLSNLPAFEKLAPPPAHLYSGGLTILDLAIDRDGPRMVTRRCIDSAVKIQHAALVGERLVLCFENFLAVLPAVDAPLEDVNLGEGSPWRIDDNWFSGLHTVFPVDRDTCLVSSSGSDAALWVDLPSRKVVRRWRLPSAIYGRNYDLTPDMPVNRHYIHNDIQLGHLNSAFPDGDGGCYISTLAQGDIGHVSRDGSYTLLARGYVGCHGVRLARNGHDLYFSDSCNGRLMELKPDGTVSQKWTVESRWLHDAEQADEDVYLLSMGDRNELALVDLTVGAEQGRYSFENRGVNVQFVSIVPRRDD
jgi:hypothetical protein